MKFVCAVLFSLVVCIAADGPYLEGSDCDEKFCDRVKTAGKECFPAGGFPGMGGKGGKAGEAPQAAALNNENPILGRFQRGAGFAPTSFSLDSQQSGSGKRDGKKHCEFILAMKEMAVCTRGKLEADTQNADQLKILTDYCQGSRVADTIHQDECKTHQIHTCCKKFIPEWNMHGKCENKGQQTTETAQTAGS